MEEKKIYTTKEQFGFLEDLYNYYNLELFNKMLLPCIITMSRSRVNKKGVIRGYFSAKQWNRNKNPDKHYDYHEISINPMFINNDYLKWHSTFVHEMAHLWQQDFGKPGKNGYHNIEWGNKMKEIGLMPSNTGLPDGKQTGYQMTHYIIEGGKFETSFNKITATKEVPYINQFIYDIDLSVDDNKDGIDKDKPIEKQGKKFKYQCPCEVNIWGKFGLMLICGKCNQLFVQL